MESSGNYRRLDSACMARSASSWATGSAIAEAAGRRLIADREQLQDAARQLARLAGVLAGRHRLHGIGNGADDA